MIATLHRPFLLALTLAGGTNLCVAGAFTWDDADQQVYRTAGQFVGYDGGEGYEAWVQLDPGYTAEGGSYLVQESFKPDQPAIDGVYSWGMNGTYAVGRAFEVPVGSGTWTFLAAHNVFDQANSGFSGFNLKTAKTASGDAFDEGELVRFGFNSGYDADSGDLNTGICYSINKGVSYHYLGGAEDDGWAFATLQYSITWTGNGGYDITVTNTDDPEADVLHTSFVSMDPVPNAVEMLGTIVYGNSLNAQSITFDHYVPEPAVSGTVFALLALAFALGPASRNRPASTLRA